MTEKTHEREFFENMFRDLFYSLYEKKNNNKMRKKEFQPKNILQAYELVAYITIE